MTNKTMVLLVEDDEGHTKLLQKAFRGQDDRFLVENATNLKEAWEYLSNNCPDIIVSDLVLPDGRGIDLLLPKKESPQFPLVIMTSYGDEEVAVETMKAGAVDYVVKSDITLRAMPRIVQRALREWGHIVKQREAEEELKRVNEKLVEANKKLEHLANYDVLTGVANRRNFMDTFEKEWKRSRRNKLPLSLIMIDVDFFKAYNDNYGHQAGDECLKNIAPLLQEVLTRPGDMAARYGGEEFVVILPETNLEGTTLIAEKMRKKVESAKIAHDLSTISDYVTISLGTATTIPSIRKKPDSLIAAADEALYKAKRNGRNRIEVS
jgi:diguanylate cyclase (GGDEF)-like protein